MISFKQFFKNNTLLKDAKLSTFELDLLSQCVVATGCTVRVKNMHNEPSSTTYFTLFVSREQFSEDYFKLLALKLEIQSFPGQSNAFSIFGALPELDTNDTQMSSMAIALYLGARPDVLSGEYPSEYDIRCYSTRELYENPNRLELPSAVQNLSQGSVLGSKKSGTELGKPEHYVHTLKDTETTLFHNRIQAMLDVENMLHSKTHKKHTYRKI